MGEHTSYHVEQHQWRGQKFTKEGAINERRRLRCGPNKFRGTSGLSPRENVEVLYNEMMNFVAFAMTGYVMFEWQMSD